MPALPPAQSVAASQQPLRPLRRPPPQPRTVYRAIVPNVLACMTTIQTNFLSVVSYKAAERERDREREAERVTDTLI